MQIKRYTAPSMSEALQLIKTELGPNAVILSARSIKRGSALLWPLRKPAVEVTAATERKTPHDPSAQGLNHSGVQAAADPAPLKGRPPKRDAVLATYAQASHPPQPRLQNPPNTASDKERVAGEQAIDRRLSKQQVKKVYAVPIAGHFNANRQEADEVKRLAEAIKSAGFLNRPIRPAGGKQHVVAVVGPPGVGKTTTIAKLAARFTLDPKLSVACVSIDNIRITGSEQLAVFADIIGVPFLRLGDRREIKAVFSRLAQHDLILIDTPAIHRRRVESQKQLCRMLEKMPLVETHLLIDASSGEEVQADLIERCEAMGVSRLMFTKVDESRWVGNLINLPIDAGMPVSGLATGTDVPQDLDVMSPQYLANRILSTGNGSENVHNKLSRRAKPAERIFRVAEPKQDQSYFVANQNSDVFHAPDCKWTKLIKEEHIIVFADAAEARQKRFKPCRYCCHHDNRRNSVSKRQTPLCQAVGYH